MKYKMKKLLIIPLLALLVASCGPKMKGEGSTLTIAEANAMQFVKEQMGANADNIASMEIVDHDQVISNLILTYAHLKMAKTSEAYMSNQITKQRYLDIQDSIVDVCADVSNSWQYAIAVNDSLSQLEKYRGYWRHRYEVLVTMKSGATEKYKILMDSDGITPRQTESEVISEYNEITNQIIIY